MAVKRVDELGYYSLTPTQLARKVGLTPPKSRAVVDFLGLREDSEFFKNFKMGKQVHARFSQKAILRIKEALETNSIDDIWARFRPGAREKK